MTIYCTYLTVYSGNKLPPFYIGYSTVSKVENGYRVSVSSKQYKEIWKQELREHPELFKTIILSAHSTLQSATQKESYLQKFFKVHINELYINMAIAGEHFNQPECYWRGKTGTSHPMYGKHHTTETRKKMSDLRSNKLKDKSLHHMFGKQHKEETKKKMSKTHMNIQKSDQHKKSISDKMKRYHTLKKRFCQENNIKNVIKSDLEFISFLKDNGYELKG